MICSRNKLLRRKIKDGFSKALAYLFSSFGLLILASVIFFVIDSGKGTLSWNFLSSDFNTSTLTYRLDSIRDGSESYAYVPSSEEFYSSAWGVSFIDGKDNASQAVVEVNYVSSDSPMNYLVNKGDGSYAKLKKGNIISGAILLDASSQVIVITGADKAEGMKEAFDSGYALKTLTVKTLGGGIRGSLLTTLSMIGLTLLFALPSGVLTAVYLEEYAKPGKMKETIAKAIDIAGGIPSIIYGLVGAIVFIPLVNFFTGQSGGSLLSGSLTLAVMLLPTIVSASCQALQAIPKGYAASSLALGASKTQTIFKVIIPNAGIGLLTGVLLSVGRIIGESAALIYSCSTAIKDTVLLNAGSATLAVHIWSLLGQETPDYASCSAIAIIILAVDLFLNILLKIISFNMQRKLQGKED